ncbi:DUF6492 family protein [uncultured Corynebacterium sp.]|uniref:DUF6492 family protein n=1 Tax=uncultured Corynebacterium sp. TaxID=159447 RepID=UPI002598C416|nr:DUF6492 family protein [uncultured Corynebacterium sp.]
MSRRLAIYCKSFRDDFNRLKNLIDSHQRHCADIPMIVSVPVADIALLYDAFDVPAGVWIVADESYAGDENFSKYGWMYQQICKMSLSRLDFADSYFVIDSDSYFLKPLNEDVFVDRFGHLKIVASPISTRYWGENPLLDRYINGELVKTAPVPQISPLSKTSVVENLEIARLAHKGNSSLVAGERRRYISEIFNPETDRSLASLNWGPSPIFHTEILDELEELIAPLGMNWRDLIYLSPWEYEWYGYFAVRTSQHPIVPVPSECIHFASESDVSLAKEKGLSADGISKRFTAIAMASRHFDLTEF